MADSVKYRNSAAVHGCALHTPAAHELLWPASCCAQTTLGPVVVVVVVVVDDDDGGGGGGDDDDERERPRKLY